MLLLKGGTVVNGNESRRADLLADPDRGVILEVGNGISEQGHQIVNAEGKLLLPGFIDTHTHFDLEAAAFHTADDFASGTKAAVAGGCTCILDHATPNRGESLESALERWHRKADGVSSCDYGFHMAVVEWNKQVQKEIPRMIEQGVTSFKLYMAYDNLRVLDGVMYHILQEIGKNGGFAGAHCENGDLIAERMEEFRRVGKLGLTSHPKTRPPEVEAEAISRFLAIAKLAECPVYVVHLSTALGYEILEQAKERGQRVWMETCPQYLLLDESLYDLPDFQGAKYMMSPPLRRQTDRDALWEGMKRGGIDFTGTDHCSFHFHGMKDYFGTEDYTKVPNGGPGVEDRGRLLYTYGVAEGRLAREQFCRLVSENAAKAFGMFPKKGILAPGSDADIVVLNPNQRDVFSAQSQQTRLDYNPYEGWESACVIEQVYLRGRLVASHGRAVQSGLGRYLSREKFSL